MKEKITIGIFNDSFYPMIDGVVTVIDNYAKRLIKYANVIVFVPKYTGRFYDDSTLPYKVVRCNSIKIPFLDYSLPTPKIDYQFKKELEKYHLDIVHIHSPFSLGIAGINYAKRHHIPCVATMHSQFKQDFERATKNEFLSAKLTNKIIKVFNKCDECWAVNAETARIFNEDYGYKTIPRVMDNATEMLPVADKNQANNYINKLYHLKKHEKVFLFVGRINLLKNIIFIVDSLKVVKEKDKKLNFKMLFVGTGQDEDKLKSRIKQNNLEDDVILCGPIYDRVELSYYYQRADLLLFPSIYDTSAIVRIEAASQETPGLFLKNTATATTITDNINGFLSDNTIGAYSDRIIEIMKNKELYNKVSKNSYIDLYKTWSDQVSEAYQIYLELINKTKH